ncbi:MAG TPA: RtcB family protein [Candidatus Polarisedimenticolia bacterium]|nr:RtcB family protein [Candidatus Polarisedimenticolia bacterium]
MTPPHAPEPKLEIPYHVPAKDGRGVRLYAGAHSQPEPQVLERLLAVSRLPWVAEPVVGLPDLHWKDRLEIPSSTAVATESDLVLSFSSPSQNCGMNILTTPLSEGDLTEGFLDTLMESMRQEIPRRRRKPAITREEVIELCRKGAPAAARRYGLDPAVCATMELGGNALAGEEPDKQELLSAVDEKSLEMGRFSFAYIGGGNHFLELQVVSEIIDPKACAAMGLAEGSVVAMFHTGSERLGHDLGRLYSWRRKTDPKRRRKLFFRKLSLHMMRDFRGIADLKRRWNYFFKEQDYVAIPAASREGRRLLLTLKVAANYGYANRIAVTGLIQQALRRAMGSREARVGVIADLSHNTIQQERIGGRDLWVHRHNAARTVGPSALPDGHPYHGLGQPVMVPGTNQTSSFVIVGGEGASQSLNSVDHGAGRTVERFAAAGLLRPVAGRFTRKYTYDTPSAEVLPHLSDEAIDEVIAVASAARIVRPAARLRPVAVLKA